MNHFGIRPANHSFQELSTKIEENKSSGTEMDLLIKQYQIPGVKMKIFHPSHVLC